MDINKKVCCQDRNIIYCIGCDICSIQYIGESDRSLQERFSEHKGYVANQHLQKATGHHFNTKGHKIHNMIKKLRNGDPQFRKAREKILLKISTQSTRDSTGRCEFANCNRFCKKWCSNYLYFLVWKLLSMIDVHNV